MSLRLKPVVMHWLLPRAQDDNRDVSLGPEHDWASHAANAFGLMAVAYEEPSRVRAFNRPLKYPQIGIV